MKKKSINSIIVYMFIAYARACAQTAEFDSGSVEKEDRVEFRASKDGIVLCASLPHSAVDVNSLQIKFRVINNTNADIIFEEMEGILEGIRFKLQDSTGATLPLTKEGKAEMGHFFMATHHEQIGPNKSMVISVNIGHYVLIKDLGTYALTVTWSEDKLGDEDLATPRAPRLQLTGHFMLQRSSNGISVSSVD